jgi:ribosomal protein S12 methylthiotransferase accessory factor YcaO
VQVKIGTVQTSRCNSNGPQTKSPTRGHCTTRHAARVGCIGRVIEYNKAQAFGNRFTIRVPNWCADGWHKDFTGMADEFEPSTVQEMQKAAEKR